MLKKIEYRPIGVIHTPFRAPQGTPIQPSGARGVAGHIVLLRDYVAGLEDLDGFSHIHLIYHFHLARRYELRVKPFLDDEYHGLFATRAPSRPNPIGISTVRLVDIKEEVLNILDVDVVDGTPLLDIKPYVPKFDVREVDRAGWTEKRSHLTDGMKADERFVKDS